MPFLWRDGTTQSLTTGRKGSLFPSSIADDGSAITAYTTGSDQQPLVLRCATL